MINLINPLLLLTVFLTPLLGSTKGFGYEQVKVFLFVGSLTVCGILWTIYSLKHPVKIFWSNIQKSALGFIVVLFVTSLLGVDPFVSFIGTQVYFQGWILYSYLYLFFLLVTWAKIKLEKWSYILVGSSTLVGILAIKDWILLNLFHQIVPTYAGRVVSTFGQPNFYAGFLLLSLPFTHYLLKKSANLWIKVGFLISIVAILISQSRTAFLELAVLLLIWLVVHLLNKKRVYLIFIVFAMIISFLISIYFSSGLIWQEFTRLRKGEDPYLLMTSVEKRGLFWPILGQIVLDKPILGSGLESIAMTYPQFFKQNDNTILGQDLKITPVIVALLKDLPVDRSHNYLLDLLLFSGILGLLTWILLVVILIKKLVQSKVSSENTTLLVALLTYLIWIQFQNQSIVHLIYFWFLAGMIDKMGNGPSPLKELSREP